MKLSRITGRKFIETYPGGGRKVLTPNGYVEILEVHKTIKYSKFRIVLENGMILEAAHNHVIIQSNNEEVYVENSLNKIIQTTNGNSRVIEVIDLNTKEHMYDVTLDSAEEVYYSDGILSHNSGKSVTVGIYLSHVYIFDNDMDIGIAANKLGMAKEFLDKTKNIILSLPIWMQQGIKIWNKAMILGENNIRIMADSTSEQSFRGFTCNIIIVDEAAFIKSSVWDEFADSIFPSQSGLSFKKTILISTANGMNNFYSYINGARQNNTVEATDTLHNTELIGGVPVADAIQDIDKINNKNKKLSQYLKYREQIKDIIKNDDDTYTVKYNKQVPGSNGFLNYEVNWRDVPRYKSDGTIKTPEEFMEEIIAKYGVVYWNQNYANDFIGSSHTLLTQETLKRLVAKEPEEIWDNKLNIFHKPEKGHQYIMSIDPAKDGKDGFSIDVIDITGFKFRQVASANLQIDYLLMPEFIHEWCENYYNPYLIIENNEGAGQSIADQMYQTYEYENLHFDKKTDINSTNVIKSKKTYPGTRTTRKTRKQILQTMKTFIENDNLEINDNKTINEFFTFILVNNKYQADEGTHDDSIMSLALAFTLFNNTKNFEDMRVVADLLFKEQSNKEDVNITDIITIGGFDDGVEQNTTYSEKWDTPETYEEYLGHMGDFA